MGKQRERGSRAAFWREKVAEHERSGQTVREYCRRAGLNEQSFYNKRAQLRRASSVGGAPPATVQFAVIDPPSSGMPGGPAPIEITLPGGELVRIGAGAEAGTVRLVLAALRAAP